MYMFNDAFVAAKALDHVDLETFCPELSVRDLLDEFDEFAFFGDQRDTEDRPAFRRDNKHRR